jgi:hypothetical protein
MSSHAEYLLRVKPAPDDTYVASIRQVAVCSHPEVRAVVGVVAHGEGANPLAAMVHAVANAHLPVFPVSAPEAA